MSMLTFYINRAGDNLGVRQRRVLERAKKELRDSFHRSGNSRTTRGPAASGKRDASGRGGH
jgi:hypothetical protein